MLIFVYFLGVSLLHLFLIFFGNSGDFRIYAESCLRVNQIIKICAIYSCVGGIYRAINNLKLSKKIQTIFILEKFSIFLTNKIGREYERSQSPEAGMIKLQYNKSVFSAICFALIYLLMTGAHIYVAYFSENWNKPES